ncbi:MAG: hypothetical protein ACLSAH_03325 [Bilophila wadsworthia]
MKLITQLSAAVLSPTPLLLHLWFRPRAYTTSQRMVTAPLGAAPFEDAAEYGSVCSAPSSTS